MELRFPNENFRFYICVIPVTKMTSRASSIFDLVLAKYIAPRIVVSIARSRAEAEGG